MRIRTEGVVPEAKVIRLAGQCGNCKAIVVDVNPAVDVVKWIDERSRIGKVVCPTEGCYDTIFVREQTARNKTIPEDDEVELDEPEQEPDFNRAERLRAELAGERESSKEAKQELKAIRRILDIDDDADIVEEVRKVKRG